MVVVATVDGVEIIVTAVVTAVAAVPLLLLLLLSWRLAT
jgi:hypothetical protein